MRRGGVKNEEKKTFMKLIDRQTLLIENFQCFFLYFPPTPTFLHMIINLFTIQKIISVKHN